eukprot:299733_1
MSELSQPLFTTKQQMSSVIILMDRQDTLLHQFTGHKVANSILTFYLSNWNIATAVIIFLLYYILLKIAASDKRIVSILLFITLFIAFLWLLMGVLLCNKNVLYDMFWFNFTFYYKAINAVIWICCQLYLVETDTSQIIYLSEDVLNGIGTMLSVMLFGLSDGWQTKIYIKIIFGIWLLAILIQTESRAFYSNNDKTITVDGYSLSVKTVMISSLTNLNMFFGKQLLCLLWYKDKMIMNVSSVKRQWVVNSNPLQIN